MKKKRPRTEAISGSLLFLLLLCITSSAASSKKGSTPGCHLDGDKLTCELRTLSENGLNVTIREAVRARHLDLKCVEFNQESILRTNHFGYLPNLKKLSVESCLIRKIPSLAFSGLSGLVGLSFRNTGGLSRDDRATSILEIGESYDNFVR